MPATIFIRVDLPAPFSPIKASTEPGRTRNCTSDRATTPGNPLLTLATSSRYGSSGITSGRTVAAGALEAVAEANMVRYSLGKVDGATLPAYCGGGRRWVERHFDWSTFSGVINRYGTDRKSTRLNSRH